MKRAVLWMLCAWLTTTRSEDTGCPTSCECLVRSSQPTMDCSSSELTSLPEAIDPDTAVLDLSDNLLQVLSEAPWPPALVALQLSNNRLLYLNASSVDSPQLQHLDLSHNQISYIDPLAFQNNENLTTLLLRGNPLQPVEKEFLASGSIKVLDLGDCNLTDLSDKFLSGLPALRRLDLSGNPLGVVASHLLAPLPDLHHLKLNGCNLSFIDTSSFAKLTSLRSLDLGRNTLGPRVEWSYLFDKNVLLEELDLRNAGISHLPEDIFSTNTLLRKLILSENKLDDTNVSTTLGKNLRHLHYLDLTDCRLTELSESAFENATKLATLILAGNSLDPEDLEKALSSLTNLQMLSLRNCSLTTLPDRIFLKLTSLQILDVSRNHLDPNNNTDDVFTSTLRTLSRLKHLDMSYSQLHHINGSTFSEMSTLNTLVLSGNPLKTVDPGLFNSLIHLKVLELNDCGLTSLMSTVFLENITYPELEELHLSKNPLSVADKGAFLPTQLSGLHKLDLSDCNVDKIPRDAFRQFNNLTWLSLAGNKLGEDSLGFLAPLKELKVLDLGRNNLRSVAPAAFESNKKLKELRLGGNHWRCGCYVQRMWNWAKRDESNILAVQKDSSLVCEFHWSGPPGRRPSSGTISWGRYSRDPDACKPT